MRPTSGRSGASRAFAFRSVSNAIPKVLEALWLWRQFPRQIASDLSQFHHRRIAEWHQGDMSSYELLELLEWMPERGAFKTCARGGEYSEEEMTWRHIANELARLRASFHAVHGGHRYDPPTLLTKAEQLADEQEAEAAEQRREDFFGMFADRTPRVEEFDDDDDDLIRLG